MVTETLRNIQPITLSKAGAVKLFNRIDKKFVFNSSVLPEILQNASASYFIMQVKENVSELHYATEYFDTEDFAMYHMHHNQKPNRFKIRIRRYIDTDTNFIEIKTKIKGSITNKKRIKNDLAVLDKHADFFITKHTPFNVGLLFPVLRNSFTRLFLVSKNMNERVTIDFDLRYYDKDKIFDINNIAIAEVKKERSNGTSEFQKILKEKQIRPTGFSKYCIGMALTHPALKQNRFKKKLLLINKLQNNV